MFYYLLHLIFRANPITFPLLLRLPPVVFVQHLCVFLLKLLFLSSFFSVLIQRVALGRLFEPVIDSCRVLKETFFLRSRRSCYVNN